VDGHLDFDAVRIRGLAKMFGSTRALMGIDLELAGGTVTAIEGPNGAGKSTLLALLALMMRPTRGEIRFGEAVARGTDPALRGRIGVLGHSAMCYPDLTAVENLELAARLHGVLGANARISALRERFELGPWAERPVRTYSRGQLQRVALARALLHRPRLLLLDEPSTGLDARSSERLQVAVREERAAGAIVVLVTHDAALADVLADQRVRLERGRLAVRP
jgi:heme exporter protein A